MSRTPRTPFQAKLENKPVREVPVKNRGRVKIGLINPAMVPLLEEHATRRDAGYSIPEWRNLTPLERAIEVAFRRTMNLIETIEREADEDERKLKSRRK